MKFLKLLDPRDTAGKHPRISLKEQGLRAKAEFPRMVSDTELSLWRPGDSIADGTRLLLGVAPGFSLSDMRFLDILSEGLRNGRGGNLRIDVLDADNLQGVDELTRHFPGINTLVRSPLLSVWRNRKFERSLHGAIAMDYVFELLGLEEKGTRVIESVRPPSPELME